MWHNKIINGLDVEAQQKKLRGKSYCSRGWKYVFFAAATIIVVVIIIIFIIIIIAITVLYVKELEVKVCDCESDLEQPEIHKLFLSCIQQNIFQPSCIPS